MTPALASLLALLAAIVLSMFSRLNIGLIAIVLAWLIGVYLAGMKPEDVMAGFPATLFLTLAGVTLLFASAETNGTVEVAAHRILRLVRAHDRLLPILFFVIACLISSIGPGAISSVALVIPLAMVIGTRAGISPFLTSLMVANGANAGNLSPISAVGIIANTKMEQTGLGGHAGKVWFANFIAHAVVATAAYLFLIRKPVTRQEAESGAERASEIFTRAQILTLAVICLWIFGVLVFKLNLGLSAFLAALILAVARVGDEASAIKRIPWGVILMVCGVSLLIAILEKTGGMELFIGLLARLSSAQSINGLIAFVTGAISTYSSTSGVVLPTFLPMASKLATQLNSDALAIALSINVGSSLVDVSPLSTLGALCVATINDPGEARRLFYRLMIWGLSMTLIGAAFCQLFAGWLARA